MRGFFWTTGLDWRFPLLVCLSTVLTALAAGRFLFPISIIGAISVMPVTLPAAIAGWVLTFRLSRRRMALHHAAWLSAGSAGLAAVLAMALVSVVLGQPTLDLFWIAAYLAPSAILSGVVSAWFLYLPRPERQR